jgi:hypothetical protein
MIRALIAAAIVALAGQAHAAGGCAGDPGCEFQRAQTAAGFIAASDACPLTLTDDQKKVLYYNLIKGFHTPDQVGYVIKQQADAIGALSPSDRAAMCAAMKDLAAEN